MSNEGRFKSILSTILMVREDEIVDTLSSDSVDTWDSLNHISLLGALEQEFGVTINAEQIENTRSVVAMRSLLANHGIELGGDGAAESTNA